MAEHQWVGLFHPYKWSYWRPTFAGSFIYGPSSVMEKSARQLPDGYFTSPLRADRSQVVGFWICAIGSINSHGFPIVHGKINLTSRRGFPIIRIPVIKGGMIKPSNIRSWLTLAHVVFSFLQLLRVLLDLQKVVTVDSLKMQQKKWTKFFPNFTFLKKITGGVSNIHHFHQVDALKIVKAGSVYLDVPGS